MAALLRWDAVLQHRNGFYWATAFIVVTLGALLVAIPAPLRADRAAWVPALIAVNLQITTFFFMAGLLLLDRDQGTLGALAVTPLGPGSYLAARAITLTALAGVETVAIVWIAFGPGGSWLLVAAGTAALGVLYTSLGAVVASRYRSVNALLLPASVLVAALLLPLLPHFGLAPRTPFLIHPLEPALTLLRSGYAMAAPGDLLYGSVGSAAWAALAFWWGRLRLRQLMVDTGTGGA
jgi:fluoroquinolone transport system permease protein